jgi:ATP-binding cassette subfamily B protein
VTQLHDGAVTAETATSETETAEAPAAAVAAPFEPLPPPATFTPPAAWIDPDPAKGWIKRMLPVLRPHRRILVGALMASIVTLAVQLSIPQVLRAAIDNAITSHREPLTPYVAAMVVLGVGLFLFGYVQRFGMQRASIEIECQLRTMIFEHLQRQSFTFYDSVQSGQLISRANSDIRSIQMFLSFGPLLAISGLSFVAALVLMFSMDVKLTLVTVATLPFLYVVGARMRKRLFPISWMMLARAADLATIVEENVTGIRVVKSFAAEDAQISLFDRAARRLRWVSLEQVTNQAKYAPLMQIIPQMSLAVILLFGGYQVIHGSMSYGTFSAFNVYVVMLQMPFVMVGMLMMMAQRAAASAQRVYEVLDTTPDMVDSPGAVDLVDCTGHVEFRHVEFAYGNNPPVFRDLDMELQPGETVALVGRTGTGKSTVARLLPRFYDVTDGSLLIDGHDVRDLTLPSLRSHIGTVTDEPFLFSESVAANIAFARPDAKRDEIEAAARAAGAHDFILDLSEGYDTVIGERGYTLSGGQRQRIAIARTLLANPRVLILDDATSAIDAQREFEIHGALRTLMHGRTTLIIAHRLSTISLAERVVVLDQGRIVADGTHAELMRDVPLYRDILAHGEEEYEREHEHKTDEELEDARRARIEELTRETIAGRDGARSDLGSGDGIGAGLSGDLA